MKRKVKIVVFVIFTIILLFYFYNKFFYSDKDEIFLREKYNSDFIINIIGNCEDQGFIDVIWERKIYLVKGNLDSVEVKLNPSELVGISVVEDTVVVNNKTKRILVFGNINPLLFEVVVDIDSLRVINNYQLSKRIIERASLRNYVAFPKNYVEIQTR